MEYSSYREVHLNEFLADWIPLLNHPFTVFFVEGRDDNNHIGLIDLPSGITNNYFSKKETMSNNEIQKLKDQIRAIGETIDHRTHPITSLMIENDWSDEDCAKVDDILKNTTSLLLIKVHFLMFNLKRILKTSLVLDIKP